MTVWGGQAPGYPGSDNLPHPEIASSLPMTSKLGGHNATPDKDVIRDIRQPSAAYPSFQ